jgi:hypothetical protein
MLSGPPTGDEGCDGQPRAPPKRSDERRSLPEQRPPALYLERDQCPHALGGRHRREIRLVAAEACQVLPGQVDASAHQILAHVLEVLRHLEAAADRVGEGHAIRCRGAEDVKDHVADRVGRQGAVAEQVVERGVGAHGLIHSIRLDELVEGRGRDPRLPRHDRHAGHSRVPRSAAVVDRVDLGVQPVEERDPVALRVVADLVDEPGEAVDGEQRAAKPCTQQAAGHGEVLAPGPGHHLAQPGHPIRSVRAAGRRFLHRLDRRARMGHRLSPPHRRRPSAPAQSPES